MSEKIVKLVNKKETRLMSFFFSEIPEIKMELRFKADILDERIEPILNDLNNRYGFVKETETDEVKEDLLDKLDNIFNIYK